MASSSAPKSDRTGPRASYGRRLPVCPFGQPAQPASTGKTETFHCNKFSRNGNLPLSHPLPGHPKLPTSERHCSIKVKIGRWARLPIGRLDSQPRAAAAAPSPRNPEPPTPHFRSNELQDGLAAEESCRTASSGRSAQTTAEHDRGRCPPSASPTFRGPKSRHLLGPRRRRPRNRSGTRGRGLSRRCLPGLADGSGLSGAAHARARAHTHTHTHTHMAWRGATFRAQPAGPASGVAGERHFGHLSLPSDLRRRSGAGTAGARGPRRSRARTARHRPFHRPVSVRGPKSRHPLGPRLSMPRGAGVSSDRVCQDRAGAERAAPPPRLVTQQDVPLFPSQ